MLTQLEQLQKMGILPTPEPQEQKSNQAKRKSKQLDFGSLTPLQPKGTIGFMGYRETVAKKSPKSARRDDDEMDSDDDAKPLKNGFSKTDDADDDGKMDMSPEELKRQTELAEGVKKIQVSLTAFHAR